MGDKAGEVCYEKVFLVYLWVVKILRAFKKEKHSIEQLFKNTFLLTAVIERDCRHLCFCCCCFNLLIFSAPVDHCFV